MYKDPYRSVAGIYDRLFESMNEGLRMVGFRLYRPKDGMHILDVGCGTGSHLELYQRFKCHFYGLDLSASMLGVAREKLGDSAQLVEADASEMPYKNEKFDLILCMLSLHEMSPEARDWSGADLDAARRACRCHLDFASIVKRAEELMA